VGATATITYSVTVKRPDPGNLNLLATATSTSAGSTCPAGGSDPRCVSSVGVLIPGLLIVSSIAPSTATPGTGLTYTATVTNTGQTNYTGAAVKLQLPNALDDATYNFANVTTGSLVARADATVDWVFNLAVGASATATASLTVNTPDTGDKTVSVIAVSDTPGSTCPTAAPVPACGAVTTVLFPGLTITKSASATTVLPGDTITYTVGLVNTGETVYSPASFTDDLSAALTDARYNADVSVSTGTASYAGSTLSWSGALAVGASATITYSMTVLDPDSGGKHPTNTVVSTSAGSNCAAGSADTRCTAAVTVLVPGLTIASSAGVASTAPGGVVGYTVTVTNSGATPYTGATFSQALTGVSDDATYNADATATAGAVTFTNPTLRWTGNLGVGASAIITYSVTVHSADGGDNLLITTIVSTTRGNNCPAGGADPRCAVTVPVARLIISQSYPVATTTPGSVLRLSASFTNTGRVAYVGIRIDVDFAKTFDDATYNGDGSADSGSLALVAGGTVLRWTGDLPVGGTVTVTASVTVNNPDAGDKLMVTSVSSTAAGSNCPPVGAPAACSTSVGVLVPRLTITKQVDTNQVLSGGKVNYTIVATNDGETDYASVSLTDPLTGVLDDAAYNADATASRGTVSLAGDTLNWVGALPKGAVVAINFSVTTAFNDLGDAVLRNRVFSSAAGSSCPLANVLAGCATSTAVVNSGITISGLTSGFTLTGPANSTVTAQGSVTMTITTANPAGYFVSVRAVGNPAAATPQNLDSLPLSSLSVRGSGTVFTPLSTQSALTVYSQNTATGPSGNAVSNDYRVQIPFIAADTYSTQLQYIVGTQ
jgi:uncharacterized repeat protein (TIGR01451 family)